MHEGSKWWIGHFMEWFWDSNHWFPQNITWDSFRDREGIEFPMPRDLYYAFPIAFCLVGLRLVLDRFVYTPLAIHCGLKAVKNSKMAPTNSLLEGAYKFQALQSSNEKMIQGLAKKLHWSERQVKRWFRLRSRQDRVPLLEKATDSGWTFTYYLFITMFGSTCLYYNHTCINTEEYFRNYPNHTVAGGFREYLLAQLGYYLSSVYFLVTSRRRKIFVVMLFHHGIALTFLSLMYITNLNQICTLALVLHDVNDIFLEISRWFHYTDYQRANVVSFCMLTVSWFVTRIVIYPTVIVRSSLITIYSNYGLFPIFFIINFFILLFTVLNLMWAFEIVNVVFKLLRSRDSRKAFTSESSEDEMDSSGSDSAEDHDRPTD